MRVCSRVLVLAALLCSAAQAASREQRLATFIAGCEVLSDAALATPERKAAALDWLVRQTGITPQRARSMIDEYRDRPEDWRRILELVRATLLPPPPVSDGLNKVSDTTQEARDGT